MRHMSTPSRHELHNLVDALPESEVAAARRYPEYLRDLGSDPFVDLPDDERERLHALLRESRAQHEQGLGIPAGEALKRLQTEEQRPWRA